MMLQAYPASVAILWLQVGEVFGQDMSMQVHLNVEIRVLSVTFFAHGRLILLPGLVLSGGLSMLGDAAVILNRISRLIFD